MTRLIYRPPTDAPDRDPTIGQDMATADRRQWLAGFPTCVQGSVARHLANGAAHKRYVSLTTPGRLGGPVDSATLIALVCRTWHDAYTNLRSPAKQEQPKT